MPPGAVNASLALAANREGRLSAEQQRALRTLLLAAWSSGQGFGSPVSRGDATVSALLAAEREHRGRAAVDAELSECDCWYPRMPGRQSLLADFEDPQLESGIGECRSPRDCSIDTESLRCFGLAGLTLMPGRYRFYYLGRSGLIVNAEPLEPAEKYLERHRVALAKLFEVGAADVAANRRGALTEQQRARLSKRYGTASVGRRALWLSAVGAPLLGLSLVLGHYADGSTVASGLAGVLLLPICLAGVYLALTLFSFLNDIIASALGSNSLPEVQVAEGVACAHPAEGADSINYHLRIGTEVLGLLPAPDAVVYGLRYRAYHQHGNLVALEPLEGPCGMHLPRVDAKSVRAV